MEWFNLFGIFVWVLFCKPTSERPAFPQLLLFTHIKEATKSQSIWKRQRLFVKAQLQAFCFLNCCALALSEFPKATHRARIYSDNRTVHSGICPSLEVSQLQNVSVLISKSMGKNHWHAQEERRDTDYYRYDD